MGPGCTGRHFVLAMVTDRLWALILFDVKPHLLQSLRILCLLEVLLEPPVDDLYHRLWLQAHLSWWTPCPNLRPPSWTDPVAFPRTFSREKVHSRLLSLHSLQCATRHEATLQPGISLSFATVLFLGHTEHTVPVMAELTRHPGREVGDQLQWY